MADTGLDITRALQTALFSMFGKPEDIEQYLGSENPFSSFISNAPKGVREAAGGQLLAGIPEWFISKGWKQAAGSLAQGVPGAVNLAPVAELLSPLAMIPAVQESIKSQQAWQQHFEQGGTIQEWNTLTGRPKEKTTPSKVDPTPPPAPPSINARRYNLPQFATRAPSRNPVTRNQARTRRTQSRQRARVSRAPIRPRTRTRGMGGVSEF